MTTLQTMHFAEPKRRDSSAARASQIMRTIKIIPVPEAIDNERFTVEGRYEDAYHWHGGTVYPCPNYWDITFTVLACRALGITPEDFRSVIAKQYPGSHRIDRTNGTLVLRYYR